MVFKSLFKKDETLVSIDIGSTGVKLVELDLSQERPRLVNVGVASFAGEVFTNNVISKAEQVSEQVTSLLEANAIGNKRVVTAVPGPSVFTKRIKMPKMDLAELASNIQFEAGNFIPHNINAVKLDFHIVKEADRNQLDVLIVAVKNEIIDSFVDCLLLAGRDVAVVDVDYFALQNLFELTYPELLPKTVALINMGTRYSSINICRNGESLFTGDIAVGGKLFTDAICEGLGVTKDEAEKLKRTKGVGHPNQEAVQELLDKNVEYVAAEFNRQLSFFWNASGAEDGIDNILVTGGGSLVPGLLEELSEKTGIPCAAMDPFKEIDVGESFDAAYLKEIGPLMAISMGMGIRQPGDKIIPEYD